MRQLMVWVVLSFVLLSLVVPAAQACLNDREVERTEREFKSRYQKETPQSESPSPETPNRTLPLALLGVGSSLLLAAVVLCFTRQTASL